MSWLLRHTGSPCTSNQTSLCLLNKVMGLRETRRSVGKSVKSPQTFLRQTQVDSRITCCTPLRRSSRRCTWRRPTPARRPGSWLPTWPCRTSSILQNCWRTRSLRASPLSSPARRQTERDCRAVGSAIGGFCACDVVRGALPCRQQGWGGWPGAQTAAGNSWRGISFPRRNPSFAFSWERETSSSRCSLKNTHPQNTSLFKTNTYISFYLYFYSHIFPYLPIPLSLSRYQRWH